MHKKQWITMAVALVIGMFFAAAALYAGCEVPDDVKMEDPCYSSHSKGIVMFTHKKHHDEYKLGCGECHHNDKGEPLNDLKVGDCVQKCGECHKKPGEVPKSEKKKLRKMSKKDALKVELEYQAEAVHMNCRDCHKAYNKEKGLKGKDGAPVSCTQCHPKN